MKFGIRKPSPKKSIAARTTGRTKRAMKKAVNPLYGKKGMGVINNPKKSVYNAAYHRTTYGAIPSSAKSSVKTPTQKPITAQPTLNAADTINRTAQRRMKIVDIGAKICIVSFIMIFVLFIIGLFSLSIPLMFIGPIICLAICGISFLTVHVVSKLPYDIPVQEPAPDISDNGSNEQ